MRNMGRVRERCVAVANEDVEVVIRYSSLELYCFSQSQSQSTVDDDVNIFTTSWPRNTGHLHSRAYAYFETSPHIKISLTVNFSCSMINVVVVGTYLYLAFRLLLSIPLIRIYSQPNNRPRTHSTAAGGDEGGGRRGGGRIAELLQRRETGSWCTYPRDGEEKNKQTSV